VESFPTIFLSSTPLAAATCKPWRQRQKSLKVYESQTEERAEWKSQQEETIEQKE